MVVPTKDFQSDTSTSSELDDLSFEEKRVQIFAKQMLQGRLFIGTFQEKRYVDSICAYRDVVSLARQEQNLIEDILTVKKRTENIYPRDHWVGITTPDTIGAPAFYSIWVELPENTAFGTYWFKIRRIKFNKKETCLRIKVLRSVNQDDHKSAGDGADHNLDDTVLTSDAFANIKQDIKEKSLYVLENITTLANFKESVVFLCMLLATLIVSLFELLKYTSEFLLKFMNECSNLMKSAVPIFQILANLVDRLFRTLCMLIAYLFKGHNFQPQIQRIQRPYVALGNMRALPSSSRRRGVIIEEVE